MRTTITTRTSKNELLIIKIRCDDECNNGHDRWAITADLYKPNSHTLSERNLIACGCLHDEILKAKKSLKPFIDLHLSDGDGTPMYAIENGFYYYQIYKGVAKYHTSTGEDFKYFDVLCNHLRIDGDECQKLINELDDNKHLGEQAQKHLFSKFVLAQKERWLKESNEAKAILQMLNKEQPQTI